MFGKSDICPEQLNKHLPILHHYRYQLCNYVFIYLEECVCVVAVNSLVQFEYKDNTSIVLTVYIVTVHSTGASQNTFK